jgi:signal transduction histidine kinase
MKAILCVDDEKMILDSLRKELKDYFQKEYYIAIAGNGEDALEALTELFDDGYEVPLVITDYIMPRMKGDELLRTVQELYPDTFGMMLSGQADLEAVRNTIRYGNLQSFLLKPWTSVDLIGDIQKTLNLYESSQQIKAQNAVLLELNANLEQKVQEKLQEITHKNEQLKKNDFILRETVLELADSNEKLETANKEKDLLMSIVAHDLRSPLNNIHGLLNLMKLSGEVNEEQQYCLKLIDNVIDKGKQLIDDLLVIHHYEEGKEKLHLTSLSLPTFLTEILQGFEKAAQEKHIQISHEFQTDLIVTTDELVLSRILTNLISNAIKFSPTQKRLFIRVWHKDTQFYIQIQDEGQGFTTEDQQKIFQKFQKLTARPTAGESSTGLGLSIVKILVEQLQGNITLQSEWQKGSIFTLVFPLIPKT